MRGIGTVVNVGTVLAGTAGGMLVGARLPERIRTTVLQAVGLVVVVIGIDNAQVSRNIVFPLAALVIGGAVGEALSLEEALERFGEWVRRRVRTESSRFVEGFVTASLIFCVGPLTILGSLQDGLGRGADAIFVKAALDGTVAVVLASTLGIGVGLSALTVLVVQGGITLGAGALDNVLTRRMVDELTATGGVMIIGLGIRLLDLRRIRVASLLPALLVAPVLVGIFAR
jgi:uncharacterized membrane protein YqgA involved in biofilm formation